MAPSSALLRRLLRLAWPVALARLGVSGMSVVDVMVVGQFAPHELPFQALAWAPIGVLTVSGIGLLSGVQVLAARAVGAGTPELAGGAWRRGLLVAACAGALAMALVWLLGARIFSGFGISAELAVPAARVAAVLVLSVPVYFVYLTCASFLESIQRPLASTVAMWAANVVNLLLNLLLVPRFGAIGSAWCTLGARASLALAMLVWVWRLRDAERYGVRQRALGPSFAALLGVGVAAAVSTTAEAGAFSGMTIIAGRLGAQAVSAYQILLNLLATLFMISLGVASATGVLASEAVGQRDFAAAKRASFTGVAVIVCFMSLAGLVVLAGSPWISRAYTQSVELAALVSGMLWLAAAVMPPDGAQVVAAAALRARGDNWFPTASHLLAYAVVMPLLAFWLAEGRGLQVRGLMLSIFCASLLSSSVLCLRAWRLTPSAPRARLLAASVTSEKLQ